MDSKAAVVILSGGLDSTVTLARAINIYGEEDVHALTFDYGQRHRREIQSAKDVARYYNIEHDVIDLTSITSLISTSALTSDVDVPEGHYESEGMSITVVPNRNAIMANIGIGVAVADKAQSLWVGVHAGDHAVYPDCRPEFIGSLNHLALIANEGFIRGDFTVEAPFVHKSKADIVSEGAHLHAPMHLSWTCYKGGNVHCGRCSTCVERLEAFDIAGQFDQVAYEDRDYYLTVLNG